MRKRKSSGPTPPRTLPTRIPCTVPLKHLDTTVATYKRRQMKDLKQTFQTLVKTPENIWNHCKHIQHPDETLVNIRMKYLKTLEIYVCNMHVYATSRSTFATFRQNTYNIRLEQTKHLEHTLKTYMYSHYNIWNIPIYFYNINMYFQRSIYLLLGRMEARWRGARRRYRARSRGLARRLPV
jgi:hypothetical protein